jgi:hypothetical protein
MKMIDSGLITSFGIWKWTKYGVHMGKRGLVIELNFINFKQQRNHKNTHNEFHGRMYNLNQIRSRMDRV